MWCGAVLGYSIGGLDKGEMPLYITPVANTPRSSTANGDVSPSDFGKMYNPTQTRCWLWFICNGISYEEIY